MLKILINAYACSPNMGSDFESNKIIILNNTVDTRKIKRITSDSSFSIPDEFIKLKDKEYRYLIFVGSLSKGKNIESMAELLKMLGDKYFLIIVGDGEELYLKKLKKLFDSTNSLFVGYKKLEQLKPYYKLSSFSFLPGLGGLSINQAMAFGVPVICCKADGAEMDLVIKDQTGYIYSDLNDAYNYIISKNNEEWIEMGRKSQSFLYSEHSVESMMNKFIYYINKHVG